MRLIQRPEVVHEEIVLDNIRFAGKMSITDAIIHTQAMTAQDELIYRIKYGTAPLELVLGEKIDIIRFDKLRLLGVIPISRSGIDDNEFTCSVDSLGMLD